jgi:hypothetical protein
MTNVIYLQSLDALTLQKRVTGTVVRGNVIEKTPEMKPQYTNFYVLKWPEREKHLLINDKQDNSLFNPFKSVICKQGC